VVDQDVDGLGVEVDLGGCPAHVLQRCEIENQWPDLSLGALLLQCSSRKLQSAIPCSAPDAAGCHRSSYTHRSLLYPVMMTRWAYLAMTRAASKPIPFRDVPVISTAESLRSLDAPTSSSGETHHSCP
ncbi:unnamed protein product, partial [Mycena citricolor]